MCVTTVIPVSSESWLTVISAVREWITFGGLSILTETNSKCVCISLLDLYNKVIR